MQYEVGMGEKVVRIDGDIKGERERGDGYLFHRSVKHIYSIVS